MPWIADAILCHFTLVSSVRIKPAAKKNVNFLISQWGIVNIDSDSIVPSENIMYFFLFTKHHKKPINIVNENPEITTISGLKPDSFCQTLMLKCLNRFLLLLRKTCGKFNFSLTQERFGSVELQNTTSVSKRKFSETSLYTGFLYGDGIFVSITVLFDIYNILSLLFSVQALFLVAVSSERPTLRL